MKTLRLILYRILLVVAFVTTLALTILDVFVFGGYILLFGIIAWLCTGSVWGFIPDWFPDIFELWNIVEKFSHTIDKLQKEVDEKKNNI